MMIAECDNCYKITEVFIDRDGAIVCKDCLLEPNYGI